MRKQSSQALILALSLLTATFGQTPQQGEADDSEVVRISTNLVQVDAVVTDRDGKQVTDLGPEEIEVFEDNHPQKITNFSYISTQPATPPPVASNSPKPAGNVSPSVAPPPVRLRPDQVRRTIALVVDDLGMSFESTAFVRHALKNFVDNQMQPDDLVAIIRTSAGVGALQQFTSDKRQLYAAIERVRWYPAGQGNVSAFAPLEKDDMKIYTNNPQAQVAELARRAREEKEEAEEERDQSREEFFAVGTLGAVSFIVRSLGDLPGRKSVLLFSDGFRLFAKNTTRIRDNSSGGGQPGIKSESNGTVQNSRILESLRRLTDQANRASVVIYTMDARGLQTLSLTASDSTTDYSPAQLEQQLSDRRQEYFDTQSGLEYLAHLTGGFSIHDSNDLNKGITRVLDDQSGYYLIGYRPDESTFDQATGRRQFHKVTVKVKRAGLRVRSRSGFYGITDADARPLRRASGDNNLFAALTSPFSAGDLRLRLTSLFGNDQQAGSVMYSMLHIDGRDLAFKEEADGWHVALIDVAAYTFGDYGNVIDSFNRTHTIRARGEVYDDILRDGLLYTLNIPVKKPGVYQLRIAVRDDASKRVGSASQLIEVPNLNENHLTLSGLVIMGIDTKKPDAAASDAQNSAEETGDPQAGPSVRRLHGGMSLRYVYTIYNVQLDRTTHQPQLQTQVRLFSDGKEVYTGKPMLYEMGEQPDPKHLRAAGRIQLGKDAQPGEYILQIVVTDMLAKEKYRAATQWIDFEIVK
jgi:VWFA-related protein